MRCKLSIEPVEAWREIKVREDNKQKVANWEERWNGACSMPTWKTA